MAKIIVLLTIFAFLLAPSVVWAAQGGQPGPSDNAYEKANDNARFKRGKDGKPIREKELKKVKNQKGQASEAEIKADDSADDAAAAEVQGAGAGQVGKDKTTPEKPKKKN
jgi:hypothetical protein